MLQYDSPLILDADPSIFVSSPPHVNLGTFMKPDGYSYFPWSKQSAHCKTTTGGVPSLFTLRCPFLL